MAEKRRLSDNEFWTILRKNGGLFARTAKAIEREFGFSYNRTSVKERAEKNPEELKDIREQNIDIAEEGLYDLMRNSTKESIRLEAVKYFLKTIGKTRGYVEKQEIDHTTGGKPLPALIQIIQPHEHDSIRTGTKAISCVDSVDGPDNE